ncbi:MAG: YetF domain-containing protein [Pseudomonadota bacterium]
MFLADAPALDLTLRIAILGPLGLFIVIFATRFVGLRTFSKMTAFDFVTTVAIGSLLAGAAAASTWPAFLQNAGAIVAILIAQVILALVRRQSDTAANAIANDPILLMQDSEWHLEALRTSRVSKDDVWAKLREANVCDLSQIRAVVLESTGDISVLHAGSFDETLLCNVLTIDGGIEPIEAT